MTAERAVEPPAERPVDKPEKPKGKPEKIELIQALRGIAALAVVLFHARIWISGPAFLDVGNRLFENGAAGVDLFFVISGFVMAHTTWDSPGGPRAAVRFFARRFARIWPVYAILLFAFLLAEGSLTTWVSDEANRTILGKALVFYPARAHGAPFFGVAPNGVGWTLDYEMWFYLLFAISLIAGRWRWPTLIGAFVTFLVIIPLVATPGIDWDAYHDYGMHPAILDIGASSMAWEFLAGTLIAVIYRSPFRIRHPRALATFALLAVTAVVWQQLSQEWNRHGMTGWGPAMIVMVLTLVLWHKETPLAVPRWLVWLGDVSFSLYLVHRIAQIGLVRTIPEEHATLAGGFGFVIASTVVALLLSQVSYRYLERGVAEWVKRLLVR